jgi:hypothetical protein
MMDIREIQFLSAFQQLRRHGGAGRTYIHG